jgi:hypothetical protein
MSVCTCFILHATHITGVRAPHATTPSTTAITASNSSNVDPNDPDNTGRGSRDGNYSKSEQTATDTVGLCTEGPSYLLSFWGEVEVRTQTF